MNNLLFFIFKVYSKKLKLTKVKKASTKRIRSINKQVRWRRMLTQYFRLVQINLHTTITLDTIQTIKITRTSTYQRQKAISRIWSVSDWLVHWITTGSRTQAYWRLIYLPITPRSKSRVRISDFWVDLVAIWCWALLIHPNSEKS